MSAASSILLAVAVVAVFVVDRRTMYAPAAGRFTPSVSLLLARIEGMRLLRHPLVWVGVAAVAFGFPGGFERDWAMRWGLTGSYLSTVAVAGFFVMHLATSRDRRSGTDELADSLPTGPATRVPAHLLSSLWLAVPVIALWIPFVWWRLGPTGGMTVADSILSFRWEPPIVELAQGPVLLPVVLLLAVAAGVWWRHPVVAVVIPLLLFFSPLLWIMPLTVDAGPIAPYLQNRVVDVGYGHLPWHYVFMTGLTVLAIAAAMLRRGSRRLWGSLAVIAMVAIVVGDVLRRHEWFGL